MNNETTSDSSSAVKASEPKPRETDSTGAMCTAWFGVTGAATAIDNVFPAGDNRAIAMQAYKTWPGGYGLDNAKSRFEVFFAGYCAALAAASQTPGGSAQSDPPF